MKNFILLTLLFSFNLFSQTGFYSSWGQQKLSFTSPGAMKYGLYGYDNPAILSTLTHPDIYITWSDPVNSSMKNNLYGVFTAVPNFGIGIITHNAGNESITDYLFSAAFGDKSNSFGISYGFSNKDSFWGTKRDDIVKAGFLFRPTEFLSLGAAGTHTINNNIREGFIDLAIRPFKNETLTLFADYTIYYVGKNNISNFSGGIALEAFPGIRISGRFFEHKYFSAGLNISLGNIGVGYQSHYNSNQKHSYDTYGIRVGGYDRNPFTYFTKENKYVELNLNGNLGYQRYRFFDNSNTLKEIIEQIDAAKNDKSVAGIAVNTSGMTINHEMLWEVREKLKDFRSSGKNVVIYIDRGSIRDYHFASLADKIVIDPIGLITLEGFAMGRTFLRGTLEKIGVGFEEWRYFTYKSALENFSRDEMSEGDRKQRQKLIDDFYELVRSDVASERNLTYVEFDKLVDSVSIFLAKDAIEYGLADTIARWDSIEDIIKSIEKNNKSLVSGSSLEKFILPDDNRWGEKPKIAVIYALGVCAMDEGISARTLVNDVESAVNDSRVKAIVLRVDSPGGDALASDIITEALRKGMKKKPVIISQGSVAASGGYWLSMYSDAIVAAPNTITGSIGVIGGWYYNKGMKEYLGMTTDLVKRGASADLGFGMNLPLIGLTLPDRNLSDYEQQKAETIIKTMYKEFVNKVADGRNMTYDDVDKIAEGRVWTGLDGKKLGLVDEIGGLETAINLAKERAGLLGKEIDIVEYPTPKLFNFNIFMPKIFDVEKVKEDPIINNLLFRIKNNGIPMPILPIDFIDAVK